MTFNLTAVDLVINIHEYRSAVTGKVVLYEVAQ